VLGEFELVNFSQTVFEQFDVFLSRCALIPSICTAIEIIPNLKVWTGIKRMALTGRNIDSGISGSVENFLRKSIYSGC